MEKYSKFILIGALIGLVGFPVFMLDFADLSWDTNKEVYWGAIALVAIIVTIYFDYRSRKINRDK